MAKQVTRNQSKRQQVDLSLRLKPKYNLGRLVIKPSQTQLFLGLAIISFVGIAIFTSWDYLQGLAIDIGQPASSSQTPTQESTDTNPQSAQSTPQPTVKLVADFPQDVPVYPGAIIDSSRSEVANRKAWTLTVKSTKSLSSIINEIKQSLVANGWTSDSELSDDQSVTYGASKVNLSVVVYAMSINGQTEIKYTVSQHEADTRSAL